MKNQFKIKLKNKTEKTILIQQHTLWRRRRNVLCSADTRRIATRRSPVQSRAPPTSAINQNEITLVSLANQQVAQTVKEA